MNNKKSTTGGAFFLGGRLVSWSSKKQDFTSQTIGEEEFVVVENNSKQVVWMKQMVKDIRIEINESIFIHCDNTSTVNMSKNLVLCSKTKYISIKYHMPREKFLEKEIRLQYVRTKEKITNVFTKPLPKETFEYL